jgi:hypothetical protein
MNSGDQSNPCNRSGFEAEVLLFIEGMSIPPVKFLLENPFMIKSVSLLSFQENTFYWNN